MVRLEESRKPRLRLHFQAHHSFTKHLHDSPIKSLRSHCPQHVQLHAIIYSSHKQDLKPKPGICCFMTCPVDTCDLSPKYAKKFGGGDSGEANKTGKPGN